MCDIDLVTVIKDLERKITDLQATLLHKDHALKDAVSKCKEYRTKNAKLRAQLKQLRYDHDQP